MHLRMVLMLVIIKITYFLLNFCVPSKLTRMVWDGQFIAYFLQIFSNHDSGWYERIAGTGYPFPIVDGSLDNACYAFFPAFPFLGKLLIFLLNCSPRAALFILSTLISFALIPALFSLGKQLKLEPEANNWFVFLFLFFPHHFYFSMIYTEGLFALMGILSFLFLLKRQLFWFGLCSSILVLTKIQGAVWLFSLLVFHAGFLGRERFKISHWLQFIPSIFTICLFLGFFWVQTGNPLFFKSASEQYWQGKPSNPFYALLKSITHPKEGEPFLRYTGIYALLFLIASFILLKIKDVGFSFFLLCFISILLPLSEGTAVSQPRFISVLFPFFLLLGMHVSKLQSTILKWIIACFVLLFHLATFVLWNTSHPISF